MLHDICVLFVDDELELCEKLALAFELEEFKVYTANSGENAIKVLKEHPDINFIVSDVKMPNGDGVYLLNYLRNNPRENLSIVMLSGFSESSESEFRKMGALGLLPKPIDIDNLIEYVRANISTS